MLDILHIFIFRAYIYSSDFINHLCCSNSVIKERSTNKINIYLYILLITNAYKMKNVFINKIVLNKYNRYEQVYNALRLF